MFSCFVFLKRRQLSSGIFFTGISLLCLQICWPVYLPYRKNPIKMKKIIFWNGPGYFNLFFPNDVNNFTKECKHHCCLFSRVRTNSSNYDAVIFNTRYVHDPPKRRHLNKVYIAFTMEPPHFQSPHGNRFYMGGNFYNWSLAPYQNATLPLRYYYVIKEASPFSKEHISNSFQQNKFHEKDGNSSARVLWIVSHCRTRSHREWYVNALRKHIKIDQYGRCGGKKCSGTWSDIQCIQDLGLTGQYKFFLAFENALCKDYITEKAFWPLIAGMVPILLAGLSANDYNNGVLPPNSYLDVRNFSSPKSLAAYINYLNRNDEILMSYHAWRSKYNVIPYTSQKGSPFLCEICNALHDPKLLKPTFLNWTTFYKATRLCNERYVKRILSRSGGMMLKNITRPRQTMHLKHIV